VLHGPTRIGWNEIQKVSCLISRSGRVTSLIIRATDGRKISVGNSGTAVLGPTYDLLHARLGDGIVQRCWIPSHDEHLLSPAPHAHHLDFFREC
jgi:hypothetical protein